MIYDLIIIGAGAAGLFAAANAPDHFKTLVLEKTKTPGNKLLLTGNGQCNLTNNEPIKAFLTRYGDKGKYLRPVLFPFSNLALMGFFEENALPLTIREDGKVFPKSMKSKDIVNLLLKLSHKPDVTFRYGVEIKEIVQWSEAEILGYSIQATDGIYKSKNVLVATGGESYPQTGSDGTFFSCLERLGLSLVPRRPALTPIFVQNYPYSELSGLTFSNCVIEIISEESNTVPNNKNRIKVEGSLLLTHKGFSGPAVLEISRYIKPGDKLTVNYLPDKIHDSLRRTLLKTAAEGSKQIITVLESTTSLPRRFLELICDSSNIAKDEKASRLTGKEMGALAERLTADSYNINDTGGFSTAMVTAGGVDLDEVNLRTMEAKQYPGLYFAGEVLDIDGDTGGYNLQFAFSSAMCAIKAMQHS